MRNAELIANLEAAAAALAGRLVTIRIRQPVLEHARAETYNAGGGHVVIDFAPEVFEDLRGFIRTFTHEVAHAKLHAHAAPVKDVTRAPASFKIDAHLMAAALQHPRMDTRESEAERTAQPWRDAIYKCYPYIQPGTPVLDENIIQVLRTLYTLKG